MNYASKADKMSQKQATTFYNDSLKKNIPGAVAISNNGGENPLRKRVTPASKDLIESNASYSLLFAFRQ